MLTQRLDDDAAKLDRLQARMGDMDAKAGQLVGILEAFDGRFKNLQNSIESIQRSTGTLTMIAKNIDGTRSLANVVFDRLQINSREKDFILKGPSENNIFPYLHAMGRLKDAMAANRASDLKPCKTAVPKTQQLLKAGMLQLETLFRKWLESTSNQADEDELEKTTKQLADLCTYFSTSKEETDYAVRVADVYIDIRAKHFDALLQPFFKDCRGPERGGLYEKGTSKFLPYMERFANLLKLERDFTHRILKGDELRTEALKGTISHARDMFVKKGSELNEDARQRGYSDTYFVLDILEKYWNECAPDFRDTGGLDLGNVYAMMAAFKDTAFKSFYGLIETLRKGDSASAVSADGTVHEMTSQTLNHLKRLCQWRNTVKVLLVQLGDGGWRNPRSAAGQLNKPLEYDNAALGDVLLQRYFIAALDQLAESLRSKALVYKKPTLVTVFLLNNYNHILTQMHSPPLEAVFDEPTDLKFRGLLKKQMDSYQESWKRCVESLMDVTHVSGGSLKSTMDRQTIKDRFKNFNQEFESTWSDQTRYAVPDGDLRQQIIRDVKNVIVPMYGRFLDKYKDLDFTKNRAKYIKYDKQGLERKIGHLFEPTA